MKSIAILCDENITLPLIKKSLNAFYTTVSFNSIEALKNSLGSYRPDVIICEASTRGLDARELFPDISDNYPLVIISSINKPDERRKCFLQEKHRYLSVPYFPEEIRTTVESLLN
ncbi:MAG: hypothetical protein GQ470_04870 [Gammaproteobacteria bacterium]|nr:hypothetical protein [Gammaproteobacteria bacterium]